MAKVSLPKATRRSQATHLYDETKRRLEAYGLFSEAIIRTIASVARSQAAYDHFSDFFTNIGLPEPHLHAVSKRVGVPVVDIPARIQPEKGTIVIHLPMSNPLDENQRYHIATVAAALPHYRVISFGNPSGAPYKFPQQGSSPLKLFGIAFTRHRRALVEAEIDYLRTHDVPTAHHVGYSYGAHKALIEAHYLNAGEVTSLTLIDPVAHPRGIRQLIHDFQATFAPMGKYVDRTQIPAYFEARQAAAKTTHHKGALRRPISIAIGFVMARFDLVTHIHTVLERHPHLRLTVAWGSRSELGNDAHMKVSMHHLAQSQPEHIKALRLKDDEHALANDIHLYAAIVYTGVNG